MPPLSPAATKARARRARAIQLGNTEVAEQAAQDYALARLEAEIERVVSTLPPLTEAQRERLGLLLNNGSA